jgi:hypothetical protein
LASAGSGRSGHVRGETADYDVEPELESLVGPAGEELV